MIENIKRRGAKAPAPTDHTIKSWRDRIWSGIFVLALSSMAGLVGYALWGDAKAVLGVLLAMSLLPAAVVSPRMWFSFKWLPLLTATLVLGFFWLSELTHFLPSILTLSDVVVASFACWLIQVLARHVPESGNNAFSALNPILADTQIHAADQLHEALQLELDRSRRHQRPFCLVIVQFSKPLSRMAIQQLPKLRWTLELRRIDQVCLGSAPHELAIICPETDSMGVVTLINRLRTRFASVFPETSSVGWAEFPTESLTSSELMAEARRKLRQPGEQHSPVSAIVS